MPWDLLIFGLFAYWLGIQVQKKDNEDKLKKPGWSSKYWDECRTCYPGVVMKFGANSQHHLNQVMGWHREDHHEVEASGEIQKARVSPYRGTYDHKTKGLVLFRGGL